MLVWASLVSWHGIKYIELNWIRYVWKLAAALVALTVQCGGPKQMGFSYASKLSFTIYADSKIPIIGGPMLEEWDMCLVSIDSWYDSTH